MRPRLKSNRPRMGGRDFQTLAAPRHCSSPISLGPSDVERGGKTYDHDEQAPFIAAVVFRRLNCDRTLFFVPSAATANSADHRKEMLSFAKCWGDGAGIRHFFEKAVEVVVVRGAQFAVGCAKDAPETGELHRAG